MVSTAKALANSNLDNKTIFLTGAMIPDEFGSSFDGFFNLGYALSCVQTLAPGIYITMQGEYFKWNEIRKNPKIGIFEKNNN